MLNRFFAFFVRKKNHGILIWGKVYRNISKTAFVKVFDFSFNRDWGQKHILQKRMIGHLEIGRGSKMECAGPSIMHGGATIVIFDGASLSIGKNVSFNTNCELYCSSSITIGDDTIFSNNCVIRDSDIHFISGSVNDKPIKIGNHVWVGTNSIILKGVTIGDGSVIGAGSVVTKDVPPHCLAAGNPARVIKENIEWKR